MERLKSTKKTVMLSLTLVAIIATLCSALVLGIGTTSGEVTAEAESSSLYDLLGFGIYPKINPDNLVITDPEDAINNYEDYISGTCCTSSSASDGLPVIILRLEGKDMADLSNVTYYYRAQEKYSEPAEGEEWKLITDDNKTDMYATLYIDDLVQPGDSFRTFIFFKTVVNEAGVGQTGAEKKEYVSEKFVDLIVDRSLSSNAYSISSITATYHANGADIKYDTDDPSWVSTYITFTVSGVSNTVDNTYFGYSYETRYNPNTGLNENIWLTAETQLNKEGKYEAVIVIGKKESTDQDIAYDGEVLFCSSNQAISNQTVYNSSRKYIKIDTNKPAFEVKAKMNGGLDDYNYGSGTSTADNHWSATDVTYTLVPITTCLSGAEYYYNINNEYQDGKQVWNRIIPKLSGTAYVYALTLSESASHLKFKAESNAGQVSSHTIDYITNIDKECPSLALSAKDASDSKISTNGYASNKVTFTLDNDNENNKSTVYFEYQIVGESSADSWTRITKSGENYTLSAGYTIVNRTYKFRAISRAGLSDEEEFTVSVLNGNFDITMDKLIYETNEQGWAKDQIAVYLNLPNVLGIDEINAYAEEYDIHSAIYGDNLSDQEVVATLVDTFTQDGTFYNKYKVFIDTSLNGNIMTFYALNKAGDKSAVLSTEALKLDLKDPTSVVKTKIYNSTVELGDDDWAYGKVLVEITPESNISGLRCFPLLGTNGQYVTGREIEAVNDVFTYSVTSSGIYRFRLISGAGRTQNPEIEVEINIDESEIYFEKDVDVTVGGVTKTISNYYATINENGQDRFVDITQETISSEVTIHFVSNQDGHFHYYYQSYTGGSPVVDAYILGEGETFKFNPPSDKGSVQFAFYLESKAVDALGQRKSSAPIEDVTISYDVTEFEIAVSWDGIKDWRDSYVEFTFTNPNIDVSIKEYQMRLEGEENWQRICDGSAAAVYKFEGVMQYSSKGVALGYAYNGKLEFRAINAAGHPSKIISNEISVKIDSTTPSPVNAINQSENGEIVYDNDNTLYYVYSNTAIRYVETNNNSDEPSFNSLSPITYYYKAYNNETSNSIVFTEDDILAGATELEGRYWLVANNQFKSSAVELYYFIIEEHSPSATLSGGTYNPTSGLYEFNWEEAITVSIEPTSDTPVYYWYKIGSNAWTKYYSDAKAADGTAWDIIFLGQADANYPEAVVGNMDETIRFKISNLSGSEYEIPARIRAKIDTESPTFNIETTVLGEEIAPADRDKWYSHEIYVRIIPTANNPGGVVYKYSTEEDGVNYERLPGDGTFFSTDDLVTYSGNGKVVINIIATARATGDWTSQTITLYVDKVVPDFELIGEITVKDTANTKKIVSGEWAQAEEVRITKNLLQDVVSNVTFTIASSTSATSTPDLWPDSSPTRVVSEVSVITVTATNEAGVSVTHTFEVNIDVDAPIINSGIIVNKMRQLADGTYVIDTDNPNRYYIDQVITYTEPNLKSAKYNNFPLANGQIIATNTVDNSNGGYVHIVIEDMAGNVSELVFYMTIFDLTVNTITLADEDIALLNSFENDYNNLKSTLTESRQEYFASTIARLWDRIATLEKQVEDYKQYLLTINSRVAFDLKSDYEEMAKYLNYFTTKDTTILYPQWEQDMITTPANTYGAYYDKLKAEFEKLKALMAVVEQVEADTEVLPATNVVERDDYSDIVRVYNAYNSLTIDQKSVFKSTLYTKLTELKRKCEVLLLQDEDTGINISGDDLAAGVTIEVENYAKSTELVNNAQLMLLENYPEGDARAIVTVNRLSLSGYGSQYDTGNITITLPIPTEYQSYIKFAVYKLSSDGTLTVVDNVTIDGDGKSVYFEADSLGTYVLATNANTTVRAQSEKVYGTINDVEIDGTLLAYITYAACGIAGLLVLILLITAIRKKWFLRAFNRAHKRNLAVRGMESIPSGNGAARTNPAYPPEKIDYKQRIYQSRKDRF